MKSFSKVFIILVLTNSIVFSQNQLLEDIPFIPLPNQINSLEGYLYARNIEFIETNSNSQRLSSAIKIFQSVWENKINSSLFEASYNSKRDKVIKLVIDLDLEIQADAYHLEIVKEEILIRAHTSEGLYRGLTTLTQLILFSSSKSNLILPYGSISDSSKYNYRGSMLDVARHFFDVNDVKRYIDIMSLYKLNFLHLHLSDDQGWRIEIKKWPNLTSIGGQKEVGGTPGGFFTQKQYSELIEYAADRYITIVPEIDIPGHTNAALVSYPELNCDGISPPVFTGIDVGFSTLCANKEVTYLFLKDVIEEISLLTPGPYFHVGGDESYVTSKEDFIQIIDSVFTYVEKNKKTAITWGNNSKTGKILQYWNDESDYDIIRKSESVIYSPASHAYLDMKYDSLSVFGLSWAGYSSVKNAYNWDPQTVSEELINLEILGIEAPIWTETVSTFEELSYLVFPRLLGHAEVGWTSMDKRIWKEYKPRLDQHVKYLNTLGINTTK